ncbi:MAG: hypothetical protein Q8Q59_11725 [Luteolibacter sp.]|nr:hypothetical protein [Luteolibacter sp.]
MALSSRRGDGHLWMIALGLSLLANLALLAAFGLAALESAEFRKKAAAAAPETPPPEMIAKIFPIPAESQPAPAVPASPDKRFARTSTDQAAPPEKSTAFIGERNTRATSDRAPVSSAPPLPSQTGIDPRDETDIETTQSDYQDGSLAETPPQPVPETPAPVAAQSTESAPPEPPADAPGPDGGRATPPQREALLEGPNPMDVQVPRETAMEDQIKPATQQQPAAETPPPSPVPAEAENAQQNPKPKPPRNPAFSGYQRKTAVVGSISRTGRSALDVADSPLGRYQAAISRAVEQEWQRNCVRHRDFITPGFLTVRFFVNAAGKVRSVQFVGDMETGEVQKGFTLNSIRDAEIPAMPRDLRKEYDKEPLELIFRFYF